MTFPPQQPAQQSPQQPADLNQHQAPQSPWPPLHQLTADDPATVGPYVVQGRLGAGTLGIVYGATDTAGRWVAVNLVSAEYLPDHDAVDAFLAEITQMRIVRADRVAPLLDAAVEGPQPWYATAYVPGLTLARWVNGQGALSTSMARALAAGAAEALTGIHSAGVLHHHLTPDNVLLAPQGPTVTDFGITRAVGFGAISSAGALVDTPSWLSPERIHGQAGPRSDVFAWGALVTYAATGQQPFGTGTPKTVMHRVLTEEPDLSGLPQDLVEPVTRALIKDPTKRPSARSLVHMVAGRELTATEGSSDDAHADCTAAARAIIRANWDPPIAPDTTSGNGSGHSQAVYPPTPPPPEDIDAALDDGDEPGLRTRTTTLSILAGALALVVGLGAWLLLPGADEDEAVADEVIQIALIPWEEAVVVTHLWAAILEGSGHEVEIVDHDVDPAFTDVASGEVDLFLDAWLPDTHGSYEEELGDQWVDLGSWYDNAVLTLTVPAYVDNVDSIGDLTGNSELFDDQIIGIEQEAGHMQTTEENVIPDYGLQDLELFAGSSSAMTVELDYAIQEQEPVVVTLWHPHTAYAEHDLKDLDDPEGSLGEGEQLHALAREGFGDDYPDVQGWLEQFELTENELVSLFDEFYFTEHDSERDAAHTWLNDNPEFLERTLGDAATEVNLD